MQGDIKNIYRLDALCQSLDLAKLLLQETV